MATPVIRRKRRDPGTTRTAQGVCFTCRKNPAGNTVGGPHSAFCADCQPVPARRAVNRRQAECGRCRRVFATVTDFDRHRPGTCLDPLNIGLELDGDVWGTPRGNANRAAVAARLARWRESTAVLDAGGDNSPGGCTSIGSALPGPQIYAELS